MNKYRNKKTKYKGITFHSEKEAMFCAQLDMLKRASDPHERVVDYQMQVPFQIIHCDKKICKYLADFVVKYADGSEKVIDVKGFKTAIYSLKKKLVEAQFNIKIHEV